MKIKIWLLGAVTGSAVGLAVGLESELIEAAISNDLQRISSLLDRGADGNALNADVDSALMLAADQSNSEAAECSA
jgi:ankyrin repeat protein